ncbi:MAG: hypothetical protein O3A01_08355 [bacterium]|nr:hypothetical protein [bacterium]
MFIRPLQVPNTQQFRNDHNFDPKNANHTSNSPVFTQGNEQAVISSVKATIKGDQLDFQRFAKEEEDVFLRLTKTRRRRKRREEMRSGIDTLI